MEIKDWFDAQMPMISKSLIEYSKSIEDIEYLNVDDSQHLFGEDSGWYDCHYTIYFTCKINDVAYKGEARAFLQYSDDSVEWFHFEIFDNNGIQSLVEHYDASYEKIIEEHYKYLEEQYN